MRNRTEHGFSRLTAISDAGSTPAASTNFVETSLAIGLRQDGTRSLSERHYISLPHARTLARFATDSMHAGRLS